MKPDHVKVKPQAVGQRRSPKIAMRVKVRQSLKKVIDDILENDCKDLQLRKYQLMVFELFVNTVHTRKRGSQNRGNWQNRGQHLIDQSDH